MQANLFKMPASLVSNVARLIMRGFRCGAKVAMLSKLSGGFNDLSLRRSGDGATLGGQHHSLGLLGLWQVSGAFKRGKTRVGD